MNITKVLRISNKDLKDIQLNIKHLTSKEVVFPWELLVKLERYVVGLFFRNLRTTH